MFMKPLGKDAVNQYLAGDYTNVPKCNVCSKKNCYIIVETKIEKQVPNNMYGIHFLACCSHPEEKKRKEYRTYYYSTTCNTCKPKQTYITDASMNAFIEADCKYGPMCLQCQKEYCFIKIEEGGKIFTKKCSSCLESKKI